jgi:hypothetical protein
MLKFIKRIIFGERIVGGEKVDFSKMPTYNTYEVKKRISFNAWTKRYNVSKVAKNLNK